MTTFEITIDDKSKQAKGLLAYLQTLDFIKINKKTAYSEDFIKKIERAKRDIKAGRVKVINTEKLWDSIK